MGHGQRNKPKVSIIAQGYPIAKTEEEAFSCLIQNHNIHYTLLFDLFVCDNDYCWSVSGALVVHM